MNMKKLLCLILALACVFCSFVACSSKEEESSSSTPSSSTPSEETYIYITFDYSDYAGVVWDDDFEDELEVVAGQRVGDLPKPTLAGHTFKGWYEDPTDSDTRIRASSKLSEDTTVYALFEASSSTDPNNPSNPNLNFDCSKGIHNWKYDYTDPTCEAAGTQTMKCELCGYMEIDPLYSTLPANKALGHKWAEDDAFDQEGWTTIPLGKRRACLREGCTKKEFEAFTDLTGTATISTVGSFYGGLKADALTDGKWGDGRSTQAGGDPALSSTNGTAWSVSFSFSNATDVDQIVFSVHGVGNGTGDPLYNGYEVYLWYADATDYEALPIRTGYFKPGEYGKENAHCIDLSNIEKAVLGVRVDILRGATGQDLFYEVAVAKIPDEEI